MQPTGANFLNDDRGGNRVKNIVSALLCGVCALFLFAACGETQPMETSYTVTNTGKEFVIDTAGQTITNSGDVYRYEISGNDITVIYPDGSSYWRSYSDNGWYGGWSEDYSEGRYVSGDTLLDVLSQRRNTDGASSSSANKGVAILLILLGVFNAIWPRVSWYLSYGWRFKDAEPSDMAMGVGRFSGVAIAVIGLIMLFV